MISLSRHFNKILKRETPKIQFKFNKKKLQSKKVEPIVKRE